MPEIKPRHSFNGSGARHEASQARPSSRSPLPNLVQSLLQRAVFDRRQGIEAREMMPLDAQLLVEAQDKGTGNAVNNLRRRQAIHLMRENMP